MGDKRVDKTISVRVPENKYREICTVAKRKKGVSPGVLARLLLYEFCESNESGKSAA